MVRKTHPFVKKLNKRHGTKHTPIAKKNPIYQSVCSSEKE
jgi:hypothetical protein